MSKGQVIIDIDVDGNTTVSVKGVAGSSCKSLTSKIQAALGQTIKDTKTPEYDQKHAASVKVGQ